MDKDKRPKMTAKNKTKLQLIFSILLLVVVVIIGFLVFTKNNRYKEFKDAENSKYILADGILGINNDGKVILYDSKSGEVRDALELEGEYLVNSSDDFKNIYMLNVLNGELFDISVNNNKIKKNKEYLNLGALSKAKAFDYDNGSIAVLNYDKTFNIRHKNSNNIETFSPSIDGEDIDLFRIVKDNLIFTSGEYIYSKNLSKDVSNTENLIINKVNLKMRDKDSIRGNIIAEIPSGEKLNILEQGETGWYLIEYKGVQGYISNALSNYEEINTLNGGLIKIHIGEQSSYIHKFNKKLFVHNNFGEDRGISILLELNPENLYIQNLIKLNGITKSLISNSDDKRLFVNEIIEGNDSKIRQIIKYSDIDTQKESMGFKYTSETLLDKENAYGMFGYIYYKDEKGVNVYNLKSQNKDLSINIKEDIFIPIYE